MKNILLLFALVTASISNAQMVYKVMPKPAQDFNIVLIPFGIDQAITVGELNQNGTATVGVNPDISDVSESVRKEYTSKISEALGFCDNMIPEITKKEDIDAIDPGPYFLYDTARDSIGTPKGFIVLISDTALFEWVTIPDKGSPVLGSYYDIIYVDQNFNYKGSCSEMFNGDLEDTQTNYSIDLHLKPGWNYIVFNIESIIPATGDIPAFPDKVRVSALQTLPANVKWMAYYY